MGLKEALSPEPVRLQVLDSTLKHFFNSDLIAYHTNTRIKLHVLMPLACNIRISGYQALILLVLNINLTQFTEVYA